jgi:hypothetical protein
MASFAPTESSPVITGTTAITYGSADAQFRDKPSFKVKFTMTFVYEQTAWKVLAMQETFVP